MNFSKVCLERSIPSEDFIAMLTNMSLLLMYASHMFVQCGFLTKPHLTIGALETLHFFMDNFDVINQLVLDGKCFLALNTGVWSFIGMCPNHMLFQCVS